MKTLLASLYVLLVVFGASTHADDRPPNFIIVFCDDMGYADIGPFGAEGYETPHLDRVAAEGMKFTDFYVGRSFCTPSRAALLTGCIPTRVGIGGNFGPKSKTGLHPDEMTIADLLKQKGYATACFGKWHLGHQPEFLPPQQGFDEYFGIPYSNDMWPYHPNVRHLPMEERIKRWPHLPLYEGNKIINPQVAAEDQVELTTLLAERAVKFIHDHKDEPFFVYLPNPQPHVPLFVSDKYEGKTDRGLYGDVISEIDWGVGQIINALKQNGIDENTCIVFTSDNGPWLSYGNHAGSAKPLREGKGTNFEGGFRVSCLMRWPGKIPAGRTCKEIAGTIDLLPTFAKLANAPLPKNKIDGMDISDLMLGKPDAKTPHEVFYHYDGGNRLTALRSGKWKLMYAQSYNSQRPGAGGLPGKGQRKQLELSLFDLEADIGETTNLAREYPQVVARLNAYADEMRKELGDGKQHVGTARRPIGVAKVNDRFSVGDFSKLEKIDIHFHLHSDDTRFMELAAKDRFSILNIATQSARADVMREKHRTIFAQQKAHPNRVAPVSSFSMEGWDEDDWPEKTKAFLDETFEKGAVGVKVWKNIGMVFRNKSGELVMIDDPQLDPIFDHIEQRGIVLMGHLGEPKNCWLPLEKMTVNNDRSYFKRNPQYHMYQHPDMPSYEDQIAARDRMLEKHKTLPFLAAHLASLEWSVDELARFLDRFPNAVAGTAARLGQMQYQSQRDREKVIAFLVEYQDRILYGSDSGVGASHSIPDRYQSIRESWLRDWKYFTTDEMIKVPELDDPVQGLALPKDVVTKIYQTNARRLFAMSWGQASHP